MNTSRPSRRNLLLTGAAYTGAAGLGLWMAPGVLAATPAPAKPVRMPAVTLQDLQGRAQRMDAFAPKVLMVNFWATWCPPCRAEMPSIEQLYQFMKGKPFEVVGLNQGEKADKVRAGLAQFTPPLTFPIILDTTGQIARHFEVESLPTTLIFNKKGLLVGRANGHRDFGHPSMLDFIDKLLEEPA